MTYKKDRKDIVATVEKGTAIDMTPIYTITLHRNIQAGTVLEFDAANQYITRVSKPKDVS